MSLFDCGDNYAEFYHARTRKARRDHRCGECGGHIRRGETYEVASGKWEGELWAFKTCPDCLHIRCDMTRAVDAYYKSRGFEPPGCGWQHGGMSEAWDYLPDVTLPGESRRLLAAYNASVPLRGGRRETPPWAIDEEEEAEAEAVQPAP